MAYDILMENILKGIVVSHGIKGIRLNKINTEFRRHAGNLCPLVDDEQLNQCLATIKGLHYLSDGKQGTWYAFKPPASDQVPVRHQKTLRRRSSAFFTGSNENVRPHGPVDGNNNDAGVGHADGPVDGNNNNCSASTKNTSAGRLSAKSSNASSRPSVRSKRRFSRAANPPKRTRMGLDGKKNVGTFYDYELVGDDFLMSIATIELGCKYNQNEAVRHCGLCMSGQTIRSAAMRLRNYKNIKIILNVGSVDLLHGRDFVDMRRDFQLLMQICKERNIQAIITTLAPLANVLNQEGFRPKFNAFNQFLMDTYSRTHQVIEIHKCMMDSHSQRTLFECYQAYPKYVSGSNKPHLLWNRIGRQLVLKRIKSNIGV